MLPYQTHWAQAMMAFWVSVQLFYTSGLVPDCMWPMGWQLQPLPQIETSSFQPFYTVDGNWSPRLVVEEPCSRPRHQLCGLILLNLDGHVDGRSDNSEENA